MTRLTTQQLHLPVTLPSLLFSFLVPEIYHFMWQINLKKQIFYIFIS